MDPGKCFSTLNGGNASAIYQFLNLLAQNPLEEEAARLVINDLKFGDIGELGIVELSIKLQSISAGFCGRVVGVIYSGRNNFSLCSDFRILFPFR